MEKLLDKLKKEGGAIVSSSQLTKVEIAEAGACGNMYVDADGFGFCWIAVNL